MWIYRYVKLYNVGNKIYLRAESINLGEVVDFELTDPDDRHNVLNNDLGKNNLFIFGENGIQFVGILKLY